MFVEYTFFPVGQGLFSCGKLYTDKNKKPFVWIYDCGTSNKMSVLKSEVKNLNTITFDLVAISHFDQDHINGLKYLLANKRVKRLMLPFLSDQQKIEELLVYCYAILQHQYDIEEKLTVDIINFLDNPARFVSNLIANSSINEKIEILLVPDRFYSTDEMKYNEDEIIYRYREDETLDISNVSCKIIDPHIPVICNHIWEFVPYNDVEAIEKVLSKMPADEIKEYFNKIKLSATNICSLKVNDDKKEALESLINEYRALVPVSEDRNACSLFLYGGRNDLPVQAKSRLGNDLNRHGILYTGDGNLKPIKKLNDLINFIGAKRTNNIYCLQVMHHGSHNNSCPEVAKKLQPVMSVFSADPNYGKRHPDSSVVFDFLRNNPRLTDKKLQYSFCFSDCHHWGYTGKNCKNKKQNGCLMP